MSVLTNPREVGADRIVNTLAAYERFGGPAIVVDFGTGTNFDVVSDKGEFLGGAIAPGLRFPPPRSSSARHALRVSSSTPPSAIRDQHRRRDPSGLVFGTAGEVDGIVERIRAEVGGATTDRDGGIAPVRSPTAGRSIITNPSSRWKDSCWSTRRTWMVEQEEGGLSRGGGPPGAPRVLGASGRPGIRAHVARRPRRGRAHTHVHRPRAVRFAGRRSADPGARHGGRAGRPEARHGQAAVPHAPRPRRRPPARLRLDAPRRGGLRLSTRSTSGIRSVPPGSWGPPGGGSCRSSSSSGRC